MADTKPDTTAPDPEGKNEGIVLQLPSGDPVRVVLMDENDERMNLAVNPEEGVFGYESSETSITMFLEEP